ncbi:MAG: prepilin peptidase [Clostridia bacterium]|nr:prepilin peptidase [Clostridia bacterium]
MYFNDIHILVYLAVGLLGCLVGQFLEIANKRLIEHKRIFSKNTIKDIKNKKYSMNYVLMIVMFVLYIAILYIFGIQPDYYSNIDLVAYLCLAPILVSAFIIDYKKEIIPNRLVLTAFEIGLIFVFLIGILNPNGTSLAINRVLGLFAGGGIFLAITLIGGLLAGKEAMGFGDVKFMGVLGLFFGLKNIVILAVISFLVGAVFSVGLLVLKIKKTDEYIPFGPFIVIAAFITIFVPSSLLFSWLWYFFSGKWFLKYIVK